MTLPVWLVLSVAVGVPVGAAVAGWLIRRAWHRGWQRAAQRFQQLHAEQLQEAVTRGVELEMKRRMAETAHDARTQDPTWGDVQDLAESGPGDTLLPKRRKGPAWPR